MINIKSLLDLNDNSMLEKAVKLMADLLEERGLEKKKDTFC